MFPLPLFIGLMERYNTRIKPFFGQFKFEWNPTGMRNGILNLKNPIKFNNYQPRQLWLAIWGLHWTHTNTSEYSSYNVRSQDILISGKQTIIILKESSDFQLNLVLLPPLQVYDVKQGSNLVEKIRLFIHKITAPLHPKVDANRPQSIKSLSHPFSREKQHLWVKFLLKTWCLNWVKFSHALLSKLDYCHQIRQRSQ